MKKRAFSLFLIILLIGSLFSMSSLSADSLHKRKIVSIVYDDSGSMSEKNSLNWSYANYAMQAMCGLLNAEDELYITYMSNPGESAMPQAFATNRQAAVDSIRAAVAVGSTPKKSIYTAQERLVGRYSDERANDTNSEYWLVVLTDGEFDEADNFGKAELDAELQEFARTQTAEGMDLHTIYLGIGSGAVEADSSGDLNILARQCNNGSDIMAVLSELSDSISGRTRLESEDIAPVSENAVRVTSAIPLVNISILLQNTDASLESITASDGYALQVLQQTTLHYPETVDRKTDTSLVGQALLIGSAGQMIPAGEYTLTFSGKIDTQAIDIMLEPALELRMAVLKDGKEVADLTTLKESDVVDLQMTVCESGTDREVDLSRLKTEYSSGIGCRAGGEEIASQDGMTLKGIKLGGEETEAYGTLTFAGFNPLSVSLKFTPTVSAPVIPEPEKEDYGILVSLLKNGTEITSLSSPSAKEALFSVDRNELSDNPHEIRIVLTKDGIRLTREEIDALGFTVSLNRSIPYTLLQEEDGSFTFRPESRWPILFYPSGTFTLTGFLNGEAAGSVLFRVSADRWYVDALLLFWPLPAAFLVLFWLTKRRFRRASIVRKTYYVSGDNVREGEETCIPIGPLTGAARFWNHAARKKYGQLTFIASRRGGILVKSKALEGTDHLEMPLTKKYWDIYRLFYGEAWQPAESLETRISADRALYTRNANNISVYYLEKRRKSRRSAILERSSGGEEEVVYLYEHDEDSLKDSTILDLWNRSSLVLAGKVTAETPVFGQNRLVTASKILVDTVFRGFTKPGDLIAVEESGGRVTFEEYAEGTSLELQEREKLQFPGNAPVVVGKDGYAPMPVGSRVLLFLAKNSQSITGTDGKVYSPVGGYNGVFYETKIRMTYVRPLPDTAAMHRSLETLCESGGQMEIMKKELVLLSQSE